MAEIAKISVDTNADGVPEEIVTTDAEPGANETQEDAWQPELSEIKKTVGELTNEVRTCNQRAESMESNLQTLMTANTELSRQLQEGHQTILELSDRLTTRERESRSQESAAANGSEERSSSESPSRSEALPQETPPVAPPPPNKPRRRSI